MAAITDAISNGVPAENIRVLRFIFFFLEEK